MTNTAKSMSKSTITCLSVSCPERFSACCKAGSERSLGGFVCKKCKNPFTGGKCRGYDLKKEYKQMVAIGKRADKTAQKFMTTPPATWKGCLKHDCPESWCGQCEDADAPPAKEERWCEHNKNITGKYLRCEICNPFTPAKENWEVEFDKVFVIGGKQPYYDALKSFVHSLRSQAYKEGRREAIEKVEKLLLPHCTALDGKNIIVDNLTLEDVIALKEKEKI